MASKQGTSVRLDNETHRLLKGVAFLRNESMSAIVRLTLRRYIQADVALQDRLALLSQAGLDDEAGTDK